MSYTPAVLTPTATSVAVTYTGDLVATITALSGTNPPSGGTVEFFDNGVSIGTAPVVAGVGVTSTATLAVTLTSGTHPITATYSGVTTSTGPIVPVSIDGTQIFGGSFSVAISRTIEAVSTLDDKHLRAQRQYAMFISSSGGTAGQQKTFTVTENAIVLLQFLYPTETNPLNLTSNGFETILEGDTLTLTPSENSLTGVNGGLHEIITANDFGSFVGSSAPSVDITAATVLLTADALTHQFGTPFTLTATVVS